MKTFRLLGSASIAVLITCGSSLAAPLGEAPLTITAITSEQIAGTGVRDLASSLYVSGSGSIVNPGGLGGEVGVGLRVRGIGAPQFSVDIEGSAGMESGSPFGWAGARGGITVDDLRGIEIITGADVGMIYGTPAYRAAIGGRMGVSDNADIFMEGLARAPLGSMPSDFGVRGGLRYFPGRTMTSPEVLRGPQGTLFGSDIRAYVGGSLSAVPSASRIIPAIDAGLQFKTDSAFDFGLVASLGYEHPTGDYNASAGAEVGVDMTDQLRAYLQGAIGTLGGSFSYNKIGLGGEYKVANNWAITAEAFARGPLGGLSEGGIKIGTRYYVDPVFDSGFVTDPLLGIGSPMLEGGPRLSIGKSLTMVQGGYFTPSLDLSLAFPMESGLVPALRASGGYQFPTSDITYTVGGELGYQVTPMFKPYVAFDIGAIGNFPINVVSAGAEFGINLGGQDPDSPPDPNMMLDVSVLGRGGLGSLSEAGVRVGVNFELDALQRLMSSH